jgi:2-hydroxy-3-keto-5-methylthiopentenyl-1-phosphate phosphatase
MRFLLPGRQRVNMRFMFFCDFDGTVTKEDVIDRILEEFADPLWTDIERSWIHGEIGSRDCLARQIRLIKARKHDLLDFVEAIEIDETFVEFARYCKTKAFEIVILSDGIDLFIHTILNRHGLNDIRVFSNSLGSTAEGYEMVFPYFRDDCSSQSGICKCKIMEGLASPSNINILIGDGRSDFCVAGKADLTFAKSALLDFCRSEKIPHIEQREFRDITEWLKDHVEDLFISQKSFVNSGIRRS